MPRQHPADLKLCAVALAEAADPDTASKHFGIPAKTIERWMAEAPDGSALQLAHDLALSEVPVRLAKGESSIALKHLTTTAAILADKVHRYGKDKPEPEAASVADRIDAWIVPTTQTAGSAT